MAGVKWDGPWPFWVTLPAFIVLVVVTFGMWALPLVWAPLVIIPVAIISIALWGAFKGTFRK